MTPVKKGDVIAFVFTRSATYAFGSGRGTERTTHFTLARVNGANRKGEATSLVRAGGRVLELRRKDYVLSQVMTISGGNQIKARSVFAGLTWDKDEFASADELKQAILAA